MAKARKNHRNNNQLRIISGKWRGRKLTFADIEGLRPTPDRVRETLFNWLTPSIGGSHCLDLFSGSGALGFEALSRGAENVEFVDTSPMVYQQIKDNLNMLGNNGNANLSSASEWLKRRSQPFDIIFLDPPFHQDMLPTCIDTINQKQLVNKEGWIYIEMGSKEVLPPTPKHWHLHREKIAGNVSYRLFLNNDR